MDEILNLIESVSEGFPSYFSMFMYQNMSNLSMFMFGKELLTRLVTCNFIVCGDVFVDLSL